MYEWTLILFLITPAVSFAKHDVSAGLPQPFSSMNEWSWTKWNMHRTIDRHLLLHPSIMRKTPISLWDITSAMHSLSNLLKFLSLEFPREVPLEQHLFWKCFLFPISAFVDASSISKCSAADLHKHVSIFLDLCLAAFSGVFREYNLSI